MSQTLKIDIDYQLSAVEILHKLEYVPLSQLHSAAAFGSGIWQQHSLSHIPSPNHSADLEAVADQEF